MPKAMDEFLRGPAPAIRVAGALLAQLRPALALFEAQCHCDGKWCDWCILRRDLAAIVSHLERIARGQ